MTYRIVRTFGGRMKADNVDDVRIWAAENDIEIIGEHRSPRTRAELQGEPRLKGFFGPMWDGDAIRYEDRQTYETLNMITPAEIAATAAMIRAAGMPDCCNRWLTLTPEALEANEAARAHIREGRFAVIRKISNPASLDARPPVPAIAKVDAAPPAPLENGPGPDAVTQNGFIDFKTAPPQHPDFIAFKHPVLAVSCPTCRAAAGSWCKRPSGHKAMDFHAERKAACDAAWEASGLPPISQVGPETFVYDALPGKPLAATSPAAAAKIKKTHPADAANIAAIAEATSFTATIFHGRMHQQQEGIPTLAEARAKGAEMKTTLQSNRDYIVYAVLKDGRSFPVPRDYEAPATQETTIKTKTAKKTAPAKAAAKVKPAAKGKAKAKATANARTAVAGTTSKAKKETKSDIVDRLLKSETGATRAELSEKTGWPSVNLEVAAERAGKDFKLVEDKATQKWRLASVSAKAAAKAAEAPATA